MWELYVVWKKWSGSVDEDIFGVELFGDGIVVYRKYDGV